jgi:hypothetical protein
MQLNDAEMDLLHRPQHALGRTRPKHGRRETLAARFSNCMQLETLVLTICLPWADGLKSPRLKRGGSVLFPL